MDLGKQPIKDFEEQLKECRTEAQQTPDRADQAGEETMDGEAEEKRDEKYKTISCQNISCPKTKDHPTINQT